MISASGIRKIAAGRMVLDDVTLHVAAGECLRLVGASVAAPSLLLRIIATLVRPSSGALTIDGIDAIARPGAARRALAYVGADSLAGAKLTVREYLWTIACARGNRNPSDVKAYAERCAAPGTCLDELTVQDRAAVALYAALLGRPKVLLIDRVLANMSAARRGALAESVGDARAGGAAVVVVSDEQDELSALCGRVARVGADGVHSGLATLVEPTTSWGVPDTAEAEWAR